MQVSVMTFSGVVLTGALESDRLDVRSDITFTNDNGDRVMVRGDRIEYIEMGE